MSRGTRRSLFWLTFIIFIVATPLIVGYARGYRLDLNRGALVRVGAILLKSTPKDASIILNGVYNEKRTPALLSNLIPFRSYNVRVEKSGFRVWEKNLDVEPERVTAAENIILFPVDFEGKVAMQDLEIDKFAMSPDAKSAIIFLADKRVALADVEENSAFNIDFPDSRKTLSFGNVSWSENGRMIIFSRQVLDDLIWYIYDSQQDELTNLTNLYERSLVLRSPSEVPLSRNFNSQKVMFSSNNGERLLALVDNNLVTIDLGNNLVGALNIEDVRDFDSEGDTIYIFKDPDILLFSKDGGQTIDLISSFRFAPEKISISPDGNKLAYWHKYTVGIIWLKDTTREPLKKEKSQSVVLQPISPIETFMWNASSEHVMVVLENKKFEVGEIDDRSTINTYSWNFDDVTWLDYLPKEKSLWFSREDGTLREYIDEF